MLGSHLQVRYMSKERKVRFLWCTPNLLKASTKLLNVELLHKLEVYGYIFSSRSIYVFRLLVFHDINEGVPQDSVFGPQICFCFYCSMKVDLDEQSFTTYDINMGVTHDSMLGHTHTNMLGDIPLFIIEFTINSTNIRKQKNHSSFIYTITELEELK